MSTLKTNNIQHVDRSDPSIIINTDGSVNIAGTMTYEDVTNVDAVGIITGRDNLDAQKQVHVGTGVSVKAGGLNVTAGISTFGGDVSIADKIIHTGDTNTAIRFPAADTVTVETGGSERVRIDSSGNLGINNTNPIVPLDVTTTSNEIAHFTGANGGELKFRNATSNIFLAYTNTSDIFQLGTNGQNVRVHVAVNGNVGLNETNPGHKLTVGGDGYFGFTSPSDAARQIIFNANRGSAADTLANINWQWNSKNVAQIRGIAGADTSNKDDGHLAFFTSAANSLVERLRITSAGKVGINQAVPDGMLHVFTASAGTVTADAGGDELVLESSGNTGLSILSPGTGESTIFFGNPGTNGQKDAYIRYYHESHSTTANRRTLAFVVGGGDNERMRLDSGGRLLIGTTSHTGHALSSTNDSKIQLESISSNDYGRMSLIYNGNNGVGPGFWFGKSRGTSIGSNTVVQNGDQIGGFFFHAADGTDKNSRVASIVCNIDGAPAANDTPGRIDFSTTSDGASATKISLSIKNSGLVQAPLQYFLYARRSSNQTGYDSTANYGTPMVFNQIVQENKDSSLASCFNTSNGLFTAPIAGTYLFFGGAYTTTGNVFQQCWFTLNGQRAEGTDAVQYNQSAYAFVMGQTVLRLAAGHTVGFKPYGNNNNVTISSNLHHTYFRVSMLH